MDTSATPAPRLAVVIPCRNEATTIGRVVADFRAALPAASVLVVDNASSDGSAAAAAAAGARVLLEPRSGKGFALLAGFQACRDADFVIMVDGDDTYPAERAPELVALARAGADMVVATRLGDAARGAFRAGHRLGNRLFILLVRIAFGLRTEDLFSGYRVLSRRFLDASPLIARGFEVDAELSLQAAAQALPVVEMPVLYRERPMASASKLRTLRDGSHVLLAILTFFRDYRPLTFFGLLSAALLTLSLAGGAVVVSEFLRTGLVPRLPLAVLCSGLFILSALSMACGVVLSSINRRSEELAALIRQR